MNTLTKGFAKRVISMLLVTIMVFSLGVVGLTSVSAANTELAETGWTGSETFYVYNDFNDIWSVSNTVKMTNSNTNEKIFVMSGVPTSELLYFRIWDATNSQSIQPNTQNFELKPGYGEHYWAHKDWKNSFTFQSNSSYFYNWKLDLSKMSSQFSNVDVHIKFWYEYGGKSQLEVWTSNGKNTTVTNATITATPTSLTVGETVTLKASATVTNGIGSTNYTYSITNPNGSTTTYNKGSSSSMTYTPTIAGEYSCKVTVTNNGKSATSSSKTFTATPALAAPTVDVKAGSGVYEDNGTFTVAAGGSFTLDYTASHADSGVTYLYDFGDGLTPADDNTWFYSGTAGTTVGATESVTCNAYALKDGVQSAATEVTFTYKVVSPELTVSAKVTDYSGYVGDVATITVTDNSDLIGTPTYVLSDANGNAVSGAVWSGNVVTFTPAEGTNTYKVQVTAGQMNIEVSLDITAKAKVFHVILSGPQTFLEDREFALTATPMFAPDGAVSYVLEGSNGTSYNSADGKFTVKANDPGEVIYTVTATAANGVSVTDSIKVVITFDAGSYPIRILFKTSDTYGYLPTAYVDGVKVNLVKDTAILATNDTDTAEYYWYSYELPDVDFGTPIKFSVNANRQYFYNVSFTVNAAQGDFVKDGDVFCYYLAIENLNGGTNTLTNISALSEEERNWTKSAVNMIYNADVDELTASTFSYDYASFGDANCDGKLNVRDATYIQKCLAQLEEADRLSEIVSDINQDGKVSVKDATAVQKQIAGL